MTQLQNTPSFSVKDIFSATDITFFGLDFSRARMIGSIGFTDPAEIKNRYFRSWNRLFIIEQSKYNMQRVFRKSLVRYDFNIVTKRNEQCDLNTLVTDGAWHLEPSAVQEIVNEYDTGFLQPGIGLVFVVESFNKMQRSAHLYVSFFDITSRSVLLTARMKGTARGFGIRNYWLNAVYDIMVRIQRNDYTSWYKSYGR